MSDYMMRRAGDRSRSPFDRIRNFTEEGEEWWSARDLGPYLGYPRWDSLLVVIKRAEKACRNIGVDIACNFRYTQNITNCSGRNALDVHLTRYGCYQVALNAESSKVEVAAAKNYFIVMTREAELAQPRSIAPVVAVISKPWSDRFRETTQAHFCYMTINHPGYFSVVSASVAQMLMMEDELIRHLLPTSPSDLPDGSIGQHWSNYRRAKGLPPSTVKAPLLLPDRKFEAQVWIYPVAELGDFLVWLPTSYIPTHLPNYYLRKKEFRPHGSLPSASAADSTSRRLCGKPAALEVGLREQLDAVGGYAPARRSLTNGNSGSR